MAIGDVDVLEIDKEGRKGESDFGIRAGKAAIGAHFGIVAEEDEIAGGFVEPQKIIGIRKKGLEKLKNSKTQIKNYQEDKKDRKKKW